MEKLGALDANFLYSETDTVFNHVASLQQFALPQNTSASEFCNGLKTFLNGRIHLVPYLTRKIKFTPFNLDHPVWITDTEFNIENHIIEVPLDAPGSMRQLEQKVAQLHSAPMDRSKPLWAVYVITGLEDGNIAYYNQAHHACLDGMAGQAATMLLMDNSPDHPVHQVPADLLDGEQKSSINLFTMAWENLVSFQIDSVSRYLGSMESMVRVNQRAIDPSKSFGALNDVAPITSFSRSIGATREYACGKLSLSQTKQIGKSLDCKVNDVFMSVCAGGLRTYLLRLGVLTDTPLIAGSPVSLRKPGDKGMGNNVTMMQVNLATHLADPGTRLLAIKASANTAKEVTAELAEGYEPNVALPGLPATITATSVLNEQLSLSDVLPMPINLVISNVPGPRETLYSNGAEMLSHYPVSIPAHGLGLNITVQSYCDDLYFSITACKKALPDASILRDDIVAAFMELKQLVLSDNVTDIIERQELQSRTQNELSGDQDSEDVAEVPTKVA